MCEHGKYIWRLNYFVSRELPSNIYEIKLSVEKNKMAKICITRQNNHAARITRLISVFNRSSGLIPEGKGGGDHNRTLTFHQLPTYLCLSSL